MVLFIVRKKNGVFCDIAGNQTAYPVVYKVPREFFDEYIPANLPEGVFFLKVRLTNDDAYAVNAEYKGEGKWILRTGNLLSK